MSKIIMEGKSVDEAVKSALEVLKVPAESARVRVIDEGEPAVLGVFGGREAKVEVKVKMEPAEEAKLVLQDILDKMSLITKVYIDDIKDDSVYLEIKGDDIPIIIGKEGHTLDSLQYLTNIIVNGGLEKRTYITVDAGDYRKKQDKRIEKIASDAAEEVIYSKEEVALPPMNARERRIVHMAIKNIGEVTSSSRGAGPDRCVVIMPK